MVSEAKSLKELNKIPTRDEVLDMGLEILAGDGLGSTPNSGASDNDNAWADL